MYTRLRDLREDHGLTQPQCAKIAFISKNSYIRYETGENTPPLDVIVMFAKYYNVSIDYIAGLTNTPKTLDGSTYNVQNINNGGKQTITNINGNNHKITIK